MATNKNHFTLVEDDFRIEIDRYHRDKPYRESLRGRLSVDKRSPAGIIAACEQILGEEWTMVCRGGQFSLARFRGAAIIMLATRREPSGGGVPIA